MTRILINWLPLLSWTVWVVYCAIHWLIPSILKREKHEIAMSIAITLFFTILLLNSYIEPLIDENIILQNVGQLIIWFALFIFVSQFFVMWKLGEGEDDWEDTTVLITSGWFRVMRHPMYFAGILCNLGTYMMKITWLGLILAPISIALCVKSAIWDEQINAVKFGKEYGDYAERVKKWGII